MSQSGIIADTSGGGFDIRTISGNSGGAVPGDAAFNVNILGGAGVNVVGSPGTNTLTVSLTGGSAAIDSIGVDAFTAPGSNPVLPDALGLLTVHGAATAAGTTPVQTNSLAANNYTVQVQTAQAIAATDATKIGLANFNSSHFSCDANGFVSLAGGGQAIDSIGTQTGTNPIAPTAGGLVTINGATVAAGTNPVRTDGTGANTMAVEVQISQALAATDATKIGLSNFNSAHFSCDANGFVSLAGGGQAIDSLLPNSGTTPVVPAADGSITLQGTGSITTVGGLNSLTAQLTGLTNHAVQVGAGTATLTQLAVGTNGQVLIGATAADPAFATLTSSDSSISFTPGANSLSLQVAGGTTSIKTITGDSGGAESPSGGNFNILGTGSITTVGTASTETVQLTGLTNHNVLVGAGTATITKVAPSATSGVPLISQGAAADPAFGTAVVAGGGTGATSLTNHGVLLGQATSPIVATAVGATGTVLAGNTGADPSFQTLATIGGITTVNGNSGSVTPTAGAITITTGASNTQGTAVFTGSGSTLTHTFSDSNNNLGLGSTALDSLSSGLRNTAYGVNALTAMAANSDATGIGYNALAANTAAQSTAIGSGALATNTSGTGSSALGYQALNLATGVNNTASGYQAGNNISTGQGNSIYGASTGQGHTTGDFNCIFGYANGASLTTSASRNIFIGTGNTSTGTSESNIYIGINIAPGTESNTFRLGNSTGTGNTQINKSVICGIRGITTGVNDAIAVLVDSANQLGTVSSSRRYKENIVDITNSDKLQQLRPVQFNYPQFSIDRPEYGLIAEEVESIFPEMVVYNDQGQPETLQYHKLYGLMIAEIQRLHKRIEALENPAV